MKVRTMFAAVAVLIALSPAVEAKKKKLVEPPPDPLQRYAPFAPEAFAPYDLPGTSAIEGQAFVKTRDGAVRYAAGSWVELRPDNTYSRESIRLSAWQSYPGSVRVYLAIKELTDLVGRRGEPPPTVPLERPTADPRAEKLTHRVRADAEGRFRFETLPAGSYLVSCAITWEDRTLGTTGGLAMASVNVGDGEEKKSVVVTE